LGLDWKQQKGILVCWKSTGMCFDGQQVRGWLKGYPKSYMDIIIIIIIIIITTIIIIIITTFVVSA